MRLDFLAVQVEHVSYLGTTQESNVHSQDQFLDAEMTTIEAVEIGISQHMEKTQDEKYEEQNDGGVHSSQIENFQNEVDPYIQIFCFLFFLFGMRFQSIYSICHLIIFCYTN